MRAGTAEMMFTGSISLAAARIAVSVYFTERCGEDGLKRRTSNDTVLPVWAGARLGMNRGKHRYRSRHLLLNDDPVQSAEVAFLGAQAQGSIFSQILVFLGDDEDRVFLPLLCEFVDSRSHISARRVSQIGVKTVAPPVNDEMVELADRQRDDHRNL